MHPGELLAGRFQIDRVAGSGGMGIVYRADDRVSGAPVAVKVMSGGPEYNDRFAQEVRVLSELTHPAIVRYVAHGVSPDGEPFLAMEWLDGEDLADRLARSGLSVVECLSVVRRVAEALASAHARGIVHRDVKPSNVLLVSGDPARAKLLDFGIVRLQLSPDAPTARAMTRTGMILGTVGYMSPEQAATDDELDARTDVFALGCVLFECLTGEPAFTGAHVVAVLAKVLLEDAPRLRHLRPELPPVLDDLVARMLSKDKAKRPADGAAVLRELAALGKVGGGIPVMGSRGAIWISAGEQRLVSILLALVPGESERLPAIVARHGGSHARLANGTIVVTLGTRGSTSEQVVSAAVCALELRDAFSLGRFALATGRVTTTAGGPPGAVIDAAAILLARSMSSGIRIDEVTAGLLGERFELRVDGDAEILVARKGETDPPRTLLGKPTPCVGRDKELALLEGTLNECVDESVARALVVTGPPGQGKSRLRHEFVRKTRARGDVTVLTANADPVGAGSAFMLVGQLVRSAMGLREGDAEEASAKLRAYVAKLCAGADVARIADFLGELIGVPTTDKPSPQLRSARNDPQIMAVWLGRSFGEWLAAACRDQALLLVLEDLHWGDLPSVIYLGDALRALADQPLMVLALGRPEVVDTFPNLWSGAEKQEVALGRLSPRAAERLVRAALGADVDAAAVTRIVERADGNAFYLEEIIRRVSEGSGDTLPDTVLALVQSRVERLDPEARRIVRAASVFGDAFWRGGIARLLGVKSHLEIEAWLRKLCEQELVTVVPEPRFRDEHEYVFRHGLVRQAAYAMLTDADKTAGHRLAGEWLEGAGEKDALTMSDHFERGSAPKKAVPWLVKAAAAALTGANTEATLALGNRGLACGAEGLDRGMLRQFRGMALLGRGELPPSVVESREATELLPAGSEAWFASVAYTFTAGMFLGDPNVTGPALQSILSAPVEPNPSGPYGMAMHVSCVALTVMGQPAFARGVLDAAIARGQRASDPDLVFLLHSRTASAYLDFVEGKIGHALAALPACRELGDRTGDAPGRAFAGLYVVEALAQAGHVARAELALRETLSFCEPHNLRFVNDYATLCIVLAKINDRDASPENVAALTPLLERSDRVLATLARTLLAQMSLQAGDLDAAVAGATKSLEQASVFPGVLTFALGVLARVELARADAAKALAFAERGLRDGSISTWPSGLSVLQLARAEALHAGGRNEDARTAIRDARDRVLRIASTFDGDAELAQSYVTRIETHARTLALADEWLGSA